jgi:hypothetical protein
MVFYRKKRLPALQPDRLQGPDRHLPAAVDERGRSRAWPLRRRRREEIERAAIGEGMRTLWDDGLAKVAAGLTSIEELARVTPKRRSSQCWHGRTVCSDSRR